MYILFIVLRRVESRINYLIRLTIMKFSIQLIQKESIIYIKISEFWIY